MADAHRFYVLSPDQAVIAGYDRQEAAEAVARDYGDGAHVVDTVAQVYHPLCQKVEDGELVYVEYGAWNTDANNRLNVLEAVKKGYAPIVRAFIAKGSDVNATDRHGATALIWAAANGKADIVHLLLAQGADPGAKDNDGDSALAVARGRSNSEVAMILEAAGASQRRVT